MRVLTRTVLICLMLLTGCHSTGNIGVVVRSSADPFSIFRTGSNFQELGFTEGQACWHFFLAIIPWAMGQLGFSKSR
jgi:hypothetical protein